MDTQQLLITLVTIAAVMGAVQGLCSYLILVERKVSAFMQDRIGPNRVGGRLALLQPIADGLKFLLKEEVVPSHVDKLLYIAAPAIAVATATLAFAVVPFGATTPDDPGHYQFVIAPRVDIGPLFVFAVGSLAVYGIILGGWASNNKYSMLGALRSSAQLVSYEIPMGMSIVGVLLLTSTLNMERAIAYQIEHGWLFLYQPLGFLLFLVSVFAETNRLPFDLPEAEQELVGGYHTEYSGLKFGLFFLGEYTHMITTSFLMVALFFGGWHLPGVPADDMGLGWVVAKLLIFCGKMTLFILFYMVVRWTIPRFRFDQLMGMAWKVLIPLAVLNLVVVLVVREFALAPWLMPVLSVALLLGAGVVAGLMPRAPARVSVVRTGSGHHLEATLVK